MRAGLQKPRRGKSLAAGRQSRGRPQRRSPAKRLRRAAPARTGQRQHRTRRRPAPASPRPTRRGRRAHRVKKVRSRSVDGRAPLLRGRWRARHAHASSGNSSSASSHTGRRNCTACSDDSRAVTRVASAATPAAGPAGRSTTRPPAATRSAPGAGAAPRPDVRWVPAGRSRRRSAPTTRCPRRESGGPRSCRRSAPAWPRRSRAPDGSESRKTTTLTVAPKAMECMRTSRRRCRRLKVSAAAV